MSYDLYYDGECIDSDIKTLEKCISLVGEYYADFQTNLVKYPEAFSPDAEFHFTDYAVFQHVPVDFEKILATNKRDSFPQSYRAEGVNFVD